MKKITRSTEKKKPSKVSDSDPKIEDFKYGKWRNFLMKNCGGYKHPVIVNGQTYLKSGLDPEADIYVFKDFVKSGK